MNLKPIAILILFIALSFGAHAQQPLNAPCGVVDGIDWPIDSINFTRDDFGLYRARFGGNHTGADIGFDHWGDPVRAAAVGRVTYSDPLGWDTEKGVIIVEHTFPDGSIFYTLYGHVEQSDTIFFPNVGDCVQRGEVLAGIGWPSRGAPHLHYEVRDFLPDDGGPGYVTGNPLSEGWYHPLDFTLLWRARLSPAFLNYATFGLVPSLPPVALDSGMVAIASGSTIEGVLPPNTISWRVETDGVITGLAGLPGDRVVAHTRNGQTVMLQGGRYAALWTVNGPDEPFVVYEGILVFVTNDGGLAAYDPQGNRLWTVAGSGAAQVSHFAAAKEIGYALENGSRITWRSIDAAGQVTYEADFAELSAAAARPDGTWLVLEGSRLWHISDGDRQQIATLDLSAGRTARLAVDARDNVYVYVGDSENTLLSLDASGELRWRESYPYPVASILPPLLNGGDGCLFYTLDADGMLNAFDSGDGALLNQLQLYAGGERSGSPRARLLQVHVDGRITFAGGFLTLVTLDGYKLVERDACTVES
jgi:murein DD-endopeptidase MepM/ murein hydrolase activator NlpD